MTIGIRALPSPPIQNDTEVWVTTIGIAQLDTPRSYLVCTPTAKYTTPAQHCSNQPGTQTLPSPKRIHTRKHTGTVIRPLGNSL